MASQRTTITEPGRRGSQLYLVSPQPAAPNELAGLLTAALGAGPAAALLLRLGAGDDRALVDIVKDLSAVIQGGGTALILDGHAELAARSGADGAHLTGIDAFNAARSALQPQRIAGCGGLESRHDAMLAGEAGADYVLFGEPDRGGHRPAFEAVLDRVAWWAELFEAPCVGYAAALEEIDQLAAAGADFVAVGDCIFADARGPAAAMAEAARRAAPAEAAA